jgi:hypothetical protein
MSRQEAMGILALFRPGTADEGDPFFAEARQLAQSDPDLARRFNEHCASYQVLRGKFQEIVVPPGLKEAIICERGIRRPFWQRYWGPLLATAAVVVVLVSVEVNPWYAGAPANNHADYLKSMAETAQLSYGMTLETNDQIRIRAFLARNKAPADYAFPAGLQDAQIAGCTISVWQGSQISMICLKTGRRLKPGSKSDLWLFVAKRTAVADSPPPGRVDFERVDPAITASWSDDSHTYVLVAVGDEELLKKYVP